MCYNTKADSIWARGAAGSAFGSHPRGRGFESLRVHQKVRRNNYGGLFLCPKSASKRHRKSLPLRLRKGKAFSEAFSHRTDTVIASARPEAAQETVAGGTDKISSLQKICVCLTAKDLITPLQSPSVTASPRRGSQGRGTLLCTNVPRNAVVFSIVSNRAPAVSV